MRILKRRWRCNRNCVRANMLLGEIDAASGAHEAAIAVWKRVEAQSSAHLALITDRLMDCYRALGREPEGLAWLRAALARHPSFELFNAVFAGTLKTQGAEAAYQLAQEELRRSPSLRGLDRYAGSRVAGRPDRAPPGPANHQGAGVQLQSAPVHVSMRKMRFQGAQVFLALPGMRQLGQFSAAEKRRMNDPKIIVALDYPDADSAMTLVDQLDPQLCRLKVGKQLFTAVGPRLVESLANKGFAVFLDLKFHDIPTTVALACKAAARPWCVDDECPCAGRECHDARCT